MLPEYIGFRYAILVFATKGVTNNDTFIGVPQSEAEKYNRVIDLDVDIGAEAVDYKYVEHIFALFLYLTVEFHTAQSPLKNRCQGSKQRCGNWKD